MPPETIAGTIDWAGPDYAGIEWFKNPPPKPQPVEPEPVFEPTTDVIERNEALLFAFKASPTVLYERFHQFGQLGVLGWCSEFSELIDEVKTLGFEGKMFTTTRDEALHACELIMKLDVDVKMQLIVLYLSSQVARLRRFLDCEHDFDDYPEPDFPLPPS